MKYRFLAITSVTILALAFGGGLVALRHWYQSNLRSTTAAPDQNKLLRIEAGMSAGEVARELQRANLIRNEWAFRWYVFSHGLSARLQAGLYNLHGGLDTPEVAQIISKGDIAAKTITIAGGLRLEQIKQILEAKGFKAKAIERALKASYKQSILASKPKQASLEGYLYPDTYRIEIGRPVSELIDLMITNTDQKVSLSIRRAWWRQGLNLHEGLTLASIVQKEVSKPEDQKQVAQVFLKRLGLKRRLEADPTFEYAASLLGVAPTSEVDSPYNTYEYGGLPPTPIASVELPAMLAVAEPATTDWLYFLSDAQGRTYFTRTEAEHKQNIDKHLR